MICGFHPQGRGSIPRIGIKGTNSSLKKPPFTPILLRIGTVTLRIFDAKRCKKPNWLNWIERKTSKYAIRLNLEVGGSSPPLGNRYYLFTQQ